MGSLSVSSADAIAKPSFVRKSNANRPNPAAPSGKVNVPFCARTPEAVLTAAEETRLRARPTLTRAVRAAHKSKFLAGDASTAFFLPEGALRGQNGDHPAW